MPKLMLINVTHSEESRVGIINNGVLESFEIESLSREHLKGNIYKGVIHRIHPALEAAFVDIGAERDAFLPLDEICFRNLPDVPPQPVDEQGKKQRRRIRDLLKPGGEILVQIAKEQFANKPPTLTTFYSLPGRYLVLLTGSDETGISRRIEGEERQRLRQLVTDLNPPDGFGLIVRTAAGLDEETGELTNDLNYLLRLWDSVQEAARHKRAPALVYREQDIVLRTIRDLFTPDIDEIHIDNEDVYLRAREFLRNVMPGKEHVLHCYRGEQPIFSAFDVESQIETVFKRRVPLRSGGTIVIDGTEALTAIDVNSGGSVRGPNPEETAFRTNLEAAAEVARQLRLRDIGGLIVVDFIDMRDNRHVQEVEQALRTAMKPDKARYETGRISRLGLLEISRQRMRPAAMATTYTSCPMCEGHGAVRTTESAALVALRKIHNRVSLGDVANLRAALPPSVALYLLNQKRDDLSSLEQRYAARIHVELRESLMPHQVEIEVKERATAPAPTPAVAPGTVAVADRPAAAAAGASNGNGNGAAAGDKKKRRRRGRKRGTGLRAASAIGIALATLGGSEPAAYEGEVASVNGHAPTAEEPTDSDDETIRETAGEASTEAAPSASPASTEASPRRGRGRRGGRGRRTGGDRARRDVAHPSHGQSATPPTNGNAEANDRRPPALHAAPEPPAPVVQAPVAVVQPQVETSAPAPAERPRRAAKPRTRTPRAGKATTEAKANGNAVETPTAKTAAPKRPRRATAVKRVAKADTAETPVAPTRPRRAPRRKPTAEA